MDRPPLLYSPPHCCGSILRAARATCCVVSCCAVLCCAAWRGSRAQPLHAVAGQSQTEAGIYDAFQDGDRLLLHHVQVGHILSFSRTLPLPQSLYLPVTRSRVYDSPRLTTLHSLLRLFPLFLPVHVHRFFWYRHYIFFFQENILIFVLPFRFLFCSPRQFSVQVFSRLCHDMNWVCERGRCSLHIVIILSTIIMAAAI